MCAFLGSAEAERDGAPQPEHEVVQCLSRRSESMDTVEALMGTHLFRRSAKVMLLLGHVCGVFLDNITDPADLMHAVRKCPSPVPLLRLLDRVVPGEEADVVPSEGSAADLVSCVAARLMQLAFHGSHRRCLARQGGAQLMSRTLRHFCDNLPVTENALGVLWLMAFSDTTTEFIKSNGASVLEHMRRAHFEHQSSGCVQERLAAIRAMCKVHF